MWVRYLIIVLSLPSLAASALAVELMTWSPGAGYPKYVLPVPAEFEALKGKDKAYLAKAAQAFTNRFNENPDLRDNLLSGRPLTPPKGTFKLWSPNETSSKPSIAVLANDVTDLRKQIKNRTRLKPILAQLSHRGGDPYVIYVASDLGLSEAEAREYRQEIARRFDSMMALGGDDLHPALYGGSGPSPPKSGPPWVLTRDRSEVELIRAFLDHGNGDFFALCRGHEALAIANGRKLVSDIHADLGDPSHRSKPHPIQIEPDSFLAKLSGKSEETVNSFHHQSVSEEHSPPGAWNSRFTDDLVTTATSTDKVPVIEANELKSGRGFSTQFHPELLKTRFGQKIMTAVVERAASARRLRLKLGADCVRKGLVPLLQ